MTKMIFVLFFTTVITVVSSTWLACTDYIEKNGDYWNPELCRGFPRDAGRFADKNRFGEDLGFTHKPGKGIRTCKTQPTSQSYSYEYPRSIYYIGQQVVLVHPMKGHAARPCTNIWIPDHGSKILRGRTRKDGNRYYPFYKQYLVADLGISPFGHHYNNDFPKRGYQNSRKFCEDKDKSMGSYSFNIPTNMAPGTYTFVWSWAFNSPTDIYTTCFDVVITANKEIRDSMLLKRSKRMNLKVACGGLTSNGDVGSSIGCEIQDNKQITSRKTTTKLATTRVTTKPATTKQLTTKPTTPMPGITTKLSTAKPTTAKQATIKKATTKPTTSTPRITTRQTTAKHITNNKTTIASIASSVSPYTTDITSAKITAETTSIIIEAKPTTSQPTTPALVTSKIKQNLPIFGYQLSGFIDIGIPPKAIRRRAVKVKFFCKIQHAIFYNVDIMEENYDNGVIKILQKKDLMSGKIEFFVSFKNCYISRKPRVVLLYEE